MSIVSLHSKRRHIFKTLLEQSDDGAYVRVNTPEQKLIFAIIIRAMLDYVHPASSLTGRENQCQRNVDNIQISARNFLFTHGEEETEFSFEWCLKYISDGPEALAKKIRIFMESPEAVRLIGRHTGRIPRPKKKRKKRNGIDYKVSLRDHHDGK